MVASIEEKVVSKGMSPILIVDLFLALVMLLAATLALVILLSAALALVIHLAAAAFRAYAASELPEEEENTC